MERQEIERIKDRVSCGVVLKQAGFHIDLKESTRRAVKYRRDGEIAIELRVQNVQLKAMLERFER